MFAADPAKFHLAPCLLYPYEIALYSTLSRRYLSANNADY